MADNGNDRGPLPVEAVADSGFIEVVRRLRLSLAVTTSPDRLAVIGVAEMEDSIVADGSAGDPGNSGRR